MKKMIKRLGSLFLVMCTILTMMPSVVMASGGDTPSAVTGVEITTLATKVQLDTAHPKMLTMQGKVTPDTAPQTLKWIVASETNATITEAGVLTPKAEGTVEVVASSTADPSKYKRKTITIVDISKEVLVATITVSGADSATSVETGKNLQMNASVLPANAKDASVTWSVDKTDIATISSTGMLSGVKAGTVKVTATAKDGSGMVGSGNVTISDPAPATVPVTGITVNSKEDATTVNVGASLEMSAVVSPTEATNQDVKWSVDDTSKATINEDSGMLTGVAAGDVEVTATAQDGSGVTGSKTITVNALPVLVTGIVVNSKDDATIIDVGASLEMSTIIVPTNATNQDVIWSVNDTSKATISETAGLLTGVAPGVVTVTATAADGSGVSGSKNIEVKANTIPVTEVKVESSATTLEAGKEMQMTVAVAPENATNKKVTWSVDKPDLASIDPSTGKLTGKAAGKVIVTATAEDNKEIVGRKEINILPEKYAITFKVTPEGAGTPAANVNGTAVTTCEAGKTVSLASNPAAGFELKGYSYKINGQTKTATSFEMPAAAVEVTVTYAKIQYTVSATASPSAGGTISGTGQVAYGDDITIKAAAKTGYTFSYWKEKDGTAKLSTNASYVVEDVKEDKEFVAVFVKKASSSATTTKKTATPTPKATTTSAAGASTGDNTKIFLWVLLLVVCAGGAGFVVYKKRKAKAK